MDKINEDLLRELIEAVKHAEQSNKLMLTEIRELLKDSAIKK